MGDTLTSEQDTYVRIGLADGRQAVLGPQTRLKIASAARLELAEGQLQVVASASPGAGRLAIEAGETIVDAGSGSFDLFYRPTRPSRWRGAPMREPAWPRPPARYEAMPAH